MSKGLNYKLTVVLLLFFFAGGLFAGQDDFSVSKKIPNKNYLPQVAMDTKGNAVVVWTSENEKDFSSNVYAAFLKYVKKTGTYRVKKAKLVSKESESNLTPFVIYDKEAKGFYCYWARTFPDNTNGAQLVVRKLTAKGKPTGDIKILFSEMLKYCYSPQVIKYPDTSNVNYAGTDYKYAITFNMVDRTDNSDQTSEIWMANLDKTPTSLKGKKKVYSTRFQDNDEFFGSMGLGQLIMQSNGSFLLPFTKQNNTGYTAYVIKISPDFKLDKTLEIGKSAEAILHLSSVSEKYSVLTWTGSGPYGLPMVQNQALTTSLSKYKGAYNPISNSFGLYPAIASLKAGGAIQLVNFINDVKGVMINKSGMAGKSFNVSEIKIFSYNNTMKEIPGKKKSLLIFSAGKDNKGVHELKGLLIDIPKS